MPVSILIDVDFPAPFGPMYATRSPASTASEMSRTASTRARAFRRPASNTFVSPWTSMATEPSWRRGAPGRGQLRDTRSADHLGITAAMGDHRQSRVIMPSEVSHRIGFFDRFAGAAALGASRAVFFAFCVALIIVWIPSYALFGNVDTWQLVINTA